MRESPHRNGVFASISPTTPNAPSTSELSVTLERHVTLVIVFIAVNRLSGQVMAYHRLPHDLPQTNYGNYWTAAHFVCLVSDLNIQTLLYAMLII
jgi:hypothetical protein